MSYIQIEDFPLLSADKYSEELCTCGSGRFKSKDVRGLNTCYEDPDSNYLLPCCDECYADAWNYYEERWEEYYSGNLGYY
jgi:hypothetical protein